MNRLQEIKAREGTYAGFQSDQDWLIERLEWLDGLLRESMEFAEFAQDVPKKCHDYNDWRHRLEVYINEADE